MHVLALAMQTGGKECISYFGSLIIYTLCQHNRPKKCRWSTLIETVQHRLKSYFGSAYS